MQPKISVIVPVYNVEKYLTKCLESLQKQTLGDFEAIVIDDGSSDSSLDIAKSFQQKDGRFKVHSQKNRGLGGARNTGIDKASGEFLFMLDSDDYIREDTFEALVAHSEEHDLDILVFNYDQVTENGDLVSRPEFNCGIYSGPEAFKKIISLKTSPQAWNKLYRAALFSDKEIYYPEQFLHEDIAVTYKLFWEAQSVGYLNTSYYYWVVRAGSITSDFNYQHINDVLTSLFNIKQHLTNQSLLESHQNQFVEGCVKMLSLMLERALKHRRFGCLDYLLFIIDKENLITDEQVQSLEESEGALLRKFRRNYKKACEHVEVAQSAGITASESTNESNSPPFKSKGISVMRSVKKGVYKISYLFFPLESSRRETLKKVLRHFF